MPLNKYDLFAIYNEMIDDGDDSLDALNKLLTTPGVDIDDLYDMDRTFLGGMYHNVLDNNPFPTHHRYDPLDDLYDDNNDDNSSDPFDDIFNSNHNSNNGFPF